MNTLTYFRRLSGLSNYSRMLVCSNFDQKLYYNKIQTNFMAIRLKYQTRSSIKSTKIAKRFKKNSQNEDDHNETEEIPINENFNLENDEDYDLIATSAMNVTKSVSNEQNVFVIQPYIKWGPKKLSSNPDLQLIEAESLVTSLPKWSVSHSMKIPLESYSKRSLFGTGKLEEIKEILHNSSTKFTCMFISKGQLTAPQKRYLEILFKIPVLDRYSIVIQILRLHAKSTEAKLQVAMAEIPYIWSQFRETDKITDKRHLLPSLNDVQKQILRNREKKLRYELSNIRAHRELLRNRRKQKNFPVIAVVGYTNAGKTSLIKALTGEEQLHPRNQLFATLDVTAHGGRLPCNLEVIFMDTVGFMSDIPTGLLECFISTLEDAMLADVIIHVQDVSHENFLEQKTHVEETLKSLIEKSTVSSTIKSNIINVGNKIDILDEKRQAEIEQNKDLICISSKTAKGMNTLISEVEEKILKVTRRTKLIVKVPNGGEEMAWLYKNAAVSSSNADPDDNQQILIAIVISDAKLEQFKFKYVYSKRND